ncbi:MAG: hypothetical protein V4509_00850 [Patescibacteria group bacterium]
MREDNPDNIARSWLGEANDPEAIRSDFDAAMGNIRGFISNAEPTQEDIAGLKALIGQVDSAEGRQSRETLDPVSQQAITDTITEAQTYIHIYEQKNQI